MPVIIKLITTNAKSIKNTAKVLSNLENKISSNINQKLTQPRAGHRQANIGSLFTTLKNTLGEATGTQIKNDILVEKRGKQIGTVKGAGANPKDIIKSFIAGKDSHIVLQFPSISKTHGLVIRPKAGEVVARRDGRTSGRYNIHITDKAITKYRKQLERTVHVALKQEVKKTLTRKQASGVQLEIAARLGVAADRITIAQSDLVGRDISRLVQAEMKRRMGKGNADNVLNYRSGRFVRSVRAEIATNELITYTFDKRHYGVHEDADGSGKTDAKGRRTTRIHALTPRGLSFRNIKTGDNVSGVMFVDIPERPIIQQSIRSVALKHFDRKFRLGLR